MARRNRNREIDRDVMDVDARDERRRDRNFWGVDYDREGGRDRWGYPSRGGPGYRPGYREGWMYGPGRYGSAGTYLPGWAYEDDDYDEEEGLERGATAWGRPRDRGRDREAGSGWHGPERARRYGRGYGEDYDSPYGPRGRYRADYFEEWMSEGPHTGRGPAGYQRSAERIREDVNERLTRHGGVDASDIEVTVENGEVTLTGTVDSRRAKRLAEDVAETVSGVRDVHNQLRVKREG